MKPLHFLPPAISLVIAGGLLGTQQGSIEKLESETVELRKRIGLASHAAMDSGDQSLATRMKEESGVDEGEIDWKDLGVKLARSEDGSMPNMRVMIELQTKVMELSGDELLAELAIIDALDLNKDVRQALDGMLMGMLAQKDPKAMLDRYKDRMEDSRGGSWQLSNAFQKWQKEDPVAALAWFDAEIGKGTFDSRSLDGRSEGRLRFEALVVGGLLTRDPAEAARRIEGLPEDQRKSLFQQWTFSNLKEEDQPAFAELVRSSLPEKEWGEAYRQAVSALTRGESFEKVDGFISSIGASSMEKEAIVEEAAKRRIQSLGNEGKLDREAVDEVRAWAMAQSPDQVDEITGKSLAGVWGDESAFADRVTIVEALHDGGAGDELIISFLNHQSRGGNSKELSRSLAERVGDGEKRAKLMEKIGE